MAPDVEEQRYLSTLLADLFRRSSRRKDRRAREGLALQSSKTPLEIQDPSQRAAMAVGSLLLLLIRERGGTALDTRALQSLARRAMDGLEEPDRARVTDEITRIFDWLSEALLDRGESVNPRSWGDVHFDPKPYLGKIRRAIDETIDLEIDYFSYNRGEWNSRRVTPTKLEGRSMLVGHCHLRGRQRRFRLTRIRSLDLLDTPESEGAQ